MTPGRGTRGGECPPHWATGAHRDHERAGARWRGTGAFAGGFGENISNIGVVGIHIIHSYHSSTCQDNITEFHHIISPHVFSSYVLIKIINIKALYNLVQL